MSLLRPDDAITLHATCRVAGGVGHLADGYPVVKGERGVMGRGMDRLGHRPALRQRRQFAYAREALQHQPAQSESAPSQHQESQWMGAAKSSSE